MDVHKHTEFKVRVLFAIHMTFLGFFSILSFIQHKYLIVVVLLLFFAVLVGLMWSIKRYGMTVWAKGLYTLIVWPFLLFLVIEGGAPKYGVSLEYPNFHLHSSHSGFFHRLFSVDTLPVLHYVFGACGVCRLCNT